MTEAKAEVHRENRDEMNRIVAEKKEMKIQLFSKRDNLIQQKRLLQQELYDPSVTQVNKDKIKEKLDKLSDEIGSTIEESKKISEEMKIQYDKAQTEHLEMIAQQELLHKHRVESSSFLQSIERQISQIDRDLIKLRNKLSTIQDKLGK